MSRKRKAYKKRPVEAIPRKPNQVSGRRLLDRITPALEVLSADLEPHGNRELHLHHVVVAHLVAFFNPAVKTLRRVQDVFNSEAVQKRFGLRRLPKSTLSDAQRVFDPTVLQPLISDLAQRLPRQGVDKELLELTKDLVAVDGTFFSVAPNIAWALFNKPKGTPRQPRKLGQRGGVRFDVHFDILRGVPVSATSCDGRTAEQDVLGKNLDSGKFYVIDRAFQDFSLLAKIIKGDSDFLVRMRRDVKFEVLRERPLSKEDRSAGVVRDLDVKLVGRSAKKSLSEQTLRLLELPPRKEGEETMLLMTNRMELTAELVKRLYTHRWQVELFFRWLKCLAGFDRFMSESRDGMTLQFYSAIIGTLLLALETESRPSVYVFAMMSAVMDGLVPLDEALPIIKERAAERARAAKWQKEYNERKKRQS